MAPVLHEVVADADDPRLVHYGAIRERDLLGRDGRFIVEGDVTLRVMLSRASRFRTESVLLTASRLAKLQAAIEGSADPPAVYVAEKPTMSAIAGYPIHRGVLGVGLREPERAPEASIAPPPEPVSVLALVGLTNHDNVGGLFRNAAAFGAAAVLLDQQTCDPLYRKAIRVSAGASLTVPFRRFPDVGAILAFAHDNELEPLALTPRSAEQFGDTVLPERALVMLGSEGPGLPAALLGDVPSVRIGMTPGFDSLNVATAGAIALHELWKRQRVVARDNRRQLSPARPR